MPPRVVPRITLVLTIAIIASACSSTLATGEATTPTDGTTSTPAPQPTGEPPANGETLITLTPETDAKFTGRVAGEMAIGLFDPVDLETIASIAPLLLRNPYEWETKPTEYDAEGTAITDPSQWPDLDQTAPLYHPTIIARVANQAYAEYLGGDPDALDRHAPQTKWLLENLVYTAEGVATWVFPMGLPDFGAPVGWRSAMTNGFGLTALLQAARLAEDPDEASDYVEAANAVLRSFTTPVEGGGVARPFEDGTACFEEIALDERPMCILNGHIFAIGGLLNAEAAGSTTAGELADIAIDYVDRNLESYDAGFMTWYSLEGRFAGPGKYNSIHVLQLVWLHDLTGNQRFLDTAIRWQDYDHQPGVTITASHSVNAESHGPDQLTDGAVWFGYWSTNRPEPAVFEATFDQPTEICGLSVYGVAEGELPFTDAILQINDLTVELVPDPIGTETNQGNTGPTAAAGFRLPSCVEASVATLTLSGRDRILALREIDFFGDRTDEVMALYRDYGRGFVPVR